MESLVQAAAHAAKASDDRKFGIRCRAGESATLRASGDSLSIQIGQRVLNEGSEEIWHSVAIYAGEDEQGNLIIRVLVSNPNWEEPLQIAKLISRPYDSDCHTALGCNLDHVTE